MAAAPQGGEGRTRPLASARSHPALDFRLDTLRLLPRWLVPPRRYIRAVAGIDREGLLGSAFELAARVRHTGGVVARILAASCAFPVALIGRSLARSARARRRADANEPAAYFEFACDARKFESSFAERFGSSR